MLHIALHFMAPALFAWLLYRPRWLYCYALMMTTMLVDLDHLLADPIYDPERCGIGFHPLHGFPAIGFYILLAILPKTRIIGFGLLIHMALDTMDCSFLLFH